MPPDPREHPVEERVTLLVENGKIIGQQFGEKRIWNTGPRMGGYEVVEFVPASRLEAVEEERDKLRKAAVSVSSEMEAVAEELVLQDRATADTLRYWITELGAGDE